METSEYGIEKESLGGLLSEAADGSSQLPDFQRGWVWDDDRVRSLLASISLGYPIGAVMMLRAGGQDVRFKARPIEGAEGSVNTQADRLILDGQQRLTSLFQSLCLEKPVLTRNPRGQTIKRWYYIDMERALDPNFDREDAIVSLPEERKIKRFGQQVVEDYSTTDLEYEAMLFPLSKAFRFSGVASGVRDDSGSMTKKRSSCGTSSMKR